MTLLSLPAFQVLLLSTTVSPSHLALCSFLRPGTYVYTHTYTHTHTHTHMYTCMYTRACTCTHTCTNKQTHTHMHTRTHTCTHTYVHVCTHVHMHLHTHMIRTHTHLLCLELLALQTEFYVLTLPPLSSCVLNSVRIRAFPKQLHSEVHQWGLSGVGGVGEGVRVGSGD